MPRRVPAAIAALVVLVACGHSSKPKATATTSPAATTTASTAPTTSGTAGPVGTWLMAQRDPTRSGVDEQSPAVDLSHATRRWQSAKIDGDVYGQPLVVGSQVIVATTNDTVYSFDVATGKQQWASHVGTPVRARDLPCGNVDPVGITGTPAVGGQQLVYAVAFVAPGRHELVALHLADGKEAFRKPVDGPGADPRTHNQRGGLLVANGRVYVPFGGRLGDCGTYHGTIVSVAVDGQGASQSYVVPSQNRAGMWSPGGLVADGSGNVFGVTGNSSSSGAFDDANAVIRLTGALKESDVWAPTNWKALNANDIDVGTETPALVPASGGLPARMLVPSKAGIAYLLDPAKLGGVGGELANKRICGSSFGGTAHAGRRAYVSCRDGVYAVDAGDRDITVVWHGPRFNSGPPIVAGGLIWALDVDGGVLYGLDAASGSARVSTRVGSVTHFATPGADGAVFVAAGGTVQAFL